MKRTQQNCGHHIMVRNKPRSCGSVLVFQSSFLRPIRPRGKSGDRTRPRGGCARRLWTFVLPRSSMFVVYEYNLWPRNINTQRGIRQSNTVLCLLFYKRTQLCQKGWRRWLLPICLSKRQNTTYKRRPTASWIFGCGVQNAAPANSKVPIGVNASRCPIATHLGISTDIIQSIHATVVRSVYIDPSVTVWGSLLVRRSVIS